MPKKFQLSSLLTGSVPLYGKIPQHITDPQHGLARKNRAQIDSAWISDLTYDRPNKEITMRTYGGPGKPSSSYTVENITRNMFDEWRNSHSKGKFFWAHIRDKYQIR
jgi:hypothetical protein